MQAEIPEWQIDNGHANRKRFEKFAGKHPRENASLFANLEKVMRILRDGHKIGGFQIGFFRSEGGGVYRIGQTVVPGAKESRLYVYPDETKRLMYTLDIGDKDSQHIDVNNAKALVKNLRAEVEKPEKQ